MQLNLSAIDMLWPRHVPSLVPRLDELGYRRFWATEHHSGYQSASPTVMVAALGAMSSHIRVGTAGIMLALTSAVKVAEDFRLLELLYPGRVDLGIIRAVPREPMRSLLLAGRQELRAGAYEARAAQLVRLVRRGGGDTLTMREQQVGPVVATSPQIWICGTSLESARLAATLGTSFSYQRHPSDHASDITGSYIVDSYRRLFKPNLDAPVPSVAIVCHGICADDSRTAEHLWFPPLGFPPDFIGSPIQCEHQLLTIRDEYGVDEIVIQSVARDISARLRSYELLAELLT